MKELYNITLYIYKVSFDILYKKKSLFQYFTQKLH